MGERASGAPPAPLPGGVRGPRGRRAPLPLATPWALDRSGPGCPSRVCPRWPFPGLWPHLSGLLCVLVSLTLSTRPPPPRRRVPGGGAPRAAPAQRGAAPAEAAGPPARPAEPLLLSHPRGERRAAPGTSWRLQCSSSSWSPRGRPGTTPPSNARGGPPPGAPCVSPWVPWEL